MHEGGGSESWYYFVDAWDDDNSRSRTNRVYIYRPSSGALDPTAVHWDIERKDSTGRPQNPIRVTPRLIETDNLGDFAVTVLETDYPVLDRKSVV